MAVTFRGTVSVPPAPPVGELLWPADIYAIVEAAIRGPLDDEHILLFACQPSEQYRRAYEEIASYRGGSLPPIAPGVLRPACLAPGYKPDRRPGGWGSWWHRSTAMLLYAPEVVISEPLTQALAGHFASDDARSGGPAVSVATALRFLRDLRPLTEAGIVHWTPELSSSPGRRNWPRIAEVVNAGPPPPAPPPLPPSEQEALVHKLGADEAETYAILRKAEEDASHGWSEQDQRIARALGGNPYSRTIEDAVDAIEPLVICERRLGGRGHALLIGALTRRQERAVAAYASDNVPTSFARLLEADLPGLVLRPADLVRVRLADDSVADFRDGLRQAVLSLPSNLTEDPEWRRAATELNANILAPIASALRREARTATTLGAFQAAGEGIAFSVAGLAAATAAGATITGPAVLAAGTISASKAARDWVAARRVRNKNTSALTAFLALADGRPGDSY